MITARHILQLKGHDVWSVSPDDSVFEALRRMADKGVGALMVLDKNDKLVGVISERDYARKIILFGKASRDTKVSEIMTSVVYTVHPEQTIDEIMELMNAKKIRHVPVVEDNGELIGVVSIGDVVKNIIYRQRETIRQYEPQRPYPSFKDD